MGNPPAHRQEKSQYTEIFEQFLEKFKSPDTEFSEVSEIARRNSYDMGRQGRIWIIGGFIYRPIIKSKYPELKISEPDQTDIDFLIDRPAKKGPYIPEGWTPHFTESGFFYLERGKTRLDFNYLFSFHSIGSVAREIGSRPEFRHFFRATPLDIQAIAYDITNKNLGVMGPGIRAINNKLVRILYENEARFEAQKRELTLEEFVMNKAVELGFNYNMKPIHPPLNPAPKKIIVVPIDINEGKVLDIKEKTPAEE